MSSDDEIPIAEVQPLCPQCGAQLLVEQAGDESKPDDRVFCPEHGTIGTRQEIHAQVYEQNRDKVVKHVQDAVRDFMKGLPFDVKRE